MGTWLLQRSQFRRADLTDLRERLAIARGLRADLAVAALGIEGILKRGEIAQGTRFPIALWESQGHRLIGALTREAELALVEAFGRLWSSNGFMAEMTDGGIVLADGDLSKEDVENLDGKIRTAIEVLNRLEIEYQERERMLVGVGLLRFAARRSKASAFQNSAG